MSLELTFIVPFKFSLMFNVRIQEVRENNVRIQEVRENNVRIQEVRENNVRIQEVRENNVRIQEVRETNVRIQDVRENNVSIQEVWNMCTHFPVTQYMTLVLSSGVHRSLLIPGKGESLLFFF